MTTEQSDALLDMVEECHLVGGLCEQKEAHAKDGTVCEDYNNAVKDLLDLYNKCLRLKVSDDTLATALTQALPTGLLVELQPKEQIESA